MNSTDIKLLILGWFFYWLIKGQSAFRENMDKFNLLAFAKLNSISFIMSIFAIYAIKLLAPSIPVEIIDLRSPLACLVAGYGGLSFVIGLLNPVKNGNPGNPPIQKP